MSLRERSKQTIADRFESGRLFNGVDELAEYYAGVVSDVWEPVLEEAAGIIACATVECPHGWEKEAIAFMVKLAELLPGSWQEVRRG